MSAFESLPGLQRSRVVLMQDVRAISTETCHFLGLEMTKSAIDLIAELVYKKLTLYGTDLEAFAKHAKRTVINADDVKLLVRRNPSLKSHLNSILTSSNTVKDKRRKTTVPKQTDASSSVKTNFSMFAKIKESTSKTKDAPRNAPEQENMAVDTTIDLTFE